MTRLPASPQNATNIPQTGFSSQQDPEGKYLAEFKRLQAQQAQQPTQEPQPLAQPQPITRVNTARELSQQIKQRDQARLATLQAMDAQFRAEDDAMEKTRKMVSQNPQRFVFDDTQKPEIRMLGAIVDAEREYKEWDQKWNYGKRDPVAKYTGIHWFASKLAQPGGAMKWADAIPLGGTVRDILEGGHVTAAVNRMKEGTATASDYNLIAGLQVAAKYESDPRLSDVIGNVLLQAPGFITEMFLTGGQAKAASILTQQAAKKMLGKSMVARGTTKVLGGAVGVAARFNPIAGKAMGVGGASFASRQALKLAKTAPTLARLAPDIINDMADNPNLTIDQKGELALVFEEGDKFLPAFMKSLGNSYIEMASESMGGVMGDALNSVISKSAAKVGMARLLTKVAEKMELPSTAIRQFAGKGEWHGPAMEFAEERAGELMRMWYGIEEGGVIPDLLAGEYERAKTQALGELLGFSLMGGGVGAAGAIERVTSPDAAEFRKNEKAINLLSVDMPALLDRNAIESLAVLQPDASREFVKAVEQNNGVPTRRMWAGIWKEFGFPPKASVDERIKAYQQLKKAVDFSDNVFQVVEPGTEAPPTNEETQFLERGKTRGIIPDGAKIRRGRGTSPQLKWLADYVGEENITYVEGMEHTAYTDPQTGRVYIGFEYATDPGKQSGDQNILWRTVADEMSHMTELDLDKDLFPEDLVKESGSKYWSSMSKARKDALEASGRKDEILLREGRARLIANFMGDQKFRDNLFEKRKPVWKRIAESVLNWFSSKPAIPEQEQKVINALRKKLESIQSARQVAPQQQTPAPAPAQTPATQQPTAPAPTQPAAQQESPTKDDPIDELLPGEEPDTGFQDYLERKKRWRRMRRKLLKSDQSDQQSDNQEESTPSPIPPESGPTGQDVPKTEEGRVPDGAKDTKTPQESDPETALDEESIPDRDNKPSDAVDADMPPEDEAVTQEGGDTTPVETSQTVWQVDQPVDVEHNGETWSGYIESIEGDIANVHWVDDDKKTGEVYEVPLSALREPSGELYDAEDGEGSSLEDLIQDEETGERILKLLEILQSDDPNAAADWAEKNIEWESLTDEQAKELRDLIESKRSEGQKEEIPPLKMDQFLKPNGETDWDELRLALHELEYQLDKQGQNRDPKLEEKARQIRELFDNRAANEAKKREETNLTNRQLDAMTIPALKKLFNEMGGNSRLPSDFKGDFSTLDQYKSPHGNITKQWYIEGVKLLQGGERKVNPSVNYTFVSGLQSSSISDIELVTRDMSRDDPLHVGFSLSRAPKIDSRAVQSAINFVNNRGGRIFIDSGAFQAFMKERDYTSNEWLGVLNWYADFIDQIDPQARERVTVVAPDVIGDQKRTADLLTKYALKIDEIANSGVKVMINLQQGKDSLSENWANLTDLFSHAENMVIGIPFNKAAYSHQDVVEFLKHQSRVVGPQTFVRVHLLGGGEAKVKLLADDAADIGSNIIISGDASLRERIRQDDTPKKPKKEKSLLDNVIEKVDGIVLDDLDEGDTSTPEGGNIPDVPSPPIEVPKIKPEGMSDKEVRSLPQSRLAEWVAGLVENDIRFTKDEFFTVADHYYGGKRANNDYTESEAYDAMEAGVNIGLFNRARNAEAFENQETAQAWLKELEQLIEWLPSQTEKSSKKDQLQQFSTPMTYAFVASYLAGIREGDTVLEPSAGTGDLALNAGVARAKVITNEIDENRAMLLRLLSIHNVIPEHHGSKIDAAMLSRIGHSTGLPTATVTLMNPPFSNDIMSGKQPGLQYKHIDEALKQMTRDGRLVAIIGAGIRGENTKTFDRWIAKIREEHGVVVNATVKPGVYQKFGTRFPTRILVIDKSQVQRQDLLTGENLDLQELLRDGERVRNERGPTSEQEFVPAEVFALPSATKSTATVQSPTDSPSGGKQPKDSADGSARKPRQKKRKGKKPAKPNAVGGDQGTRGAGGGVSDRGDRSDAPPSNVSREDDFAEDIFGAEPEVPAPTPLPSSHDREDRKARVRKTATFLVKQVEDGIIEDFPTAVTNWTNMFNRWADRKGMTDEKEREAHLLAYAGYLELAWDAIAELVDVTKREHSFAELAIPGRDRAPEDTFVEQRTVERKKKLELDNFKQYDNSFQADAPAHPGIIVETAAMKSVDLPTVPKKLLTSLSHLIRPNVKDKNGNRIKNSGLSDVQADAVILSRNAFEQKFEQEYKAPGGEIEKKLVKMGLMIGDGTGTGKGRTSAGIIYDWMHRTGQRRAVWITANRSLFDDAKRDWEDIGGHRLAPIMDFDAAKMDSMPDGVIMITYATLASLQGRNRPRDQNAIFSYNLERLYDYLGSDFDGVIIADEAHLANNPSVTNEVNQESADREGRRRRSKKDGSDQANAFNNLQSLLPNAGVVYLTATSATTVAQLGFASRLGIWGPDTKLANFKSFVSAMEPLDLVGMEQLAKDLKATGRYLARSVSLNDGTVEGLNTVKTEKLEVALSVHAREQYDSIADAIQSVLRAVEDNENAERTSHMYGKALNIYGDVMQLLMLGKMTEDIRQHLAENKEHRVVIQTASTQDARNRRAYEKWVANGKTGPVVSNLADEIVDMLYDNYDVKLYRKVDGQKVAVYGVTSNTHTELDIDQLRGIAELRSKLIQFKTTFDPTASGETRAREREIENEVGNMKDKAEIAEQLKKIIRDNNGRVPYYQHLDDPEKVAERDEIERNVRSLGMLFPVSPLDALHEVLAEYGVSEISGRTYRILTKTHDTTDPEAEGLEIGARYWKKSPPGDAYKAEQEDLFNNGSSRVLIFSNAGGTGKSYNASLSFKNQGLRKHYIFWPGWTPAAAIQGLGRTHRSYQALAPIWTLVSTDIPAHSRFISTIAKRVLQMGAITKGDRMSSGQVFNPEDDLSSTYAEQALEQFKLDLRVGAAPVGPNEFSERTNLKRSQNGSFDFTMKDFLNRLMNFKLDDQTALFEYFDEIRKRLIAEAKANDTYDDGLKTLVGDNPRIARGLIHPEHDTTYLAITTTQPNKIRFIKDLDLSEGYDEYAMAINQISGRPIFFAKSYMDDNVGGRVQKRVMVVRPTGGFSHHKYDDWLRKEAHKFQFVTSRGSTVNYVTVDEQGNRTEGSYLLTESKWKEMWDMEAENAPDTIEETHHMLTGQLLPHLHRLQNASFYLRQVNIDGVNHVGLTFKNLALLSSIGMGDKVWPSVDVIRRELLSGNITSVALGQQALRLKAVRKGNETRIEVENATEQKDLDVIQQAGGWYTRENRIRAWMPTDNNEALERLLEVFAIREVRVSDGFDESSLYESDLDSTDNQQPPLGAEREPLSVEKIIHPQASIEARMSRDAPDPTTREKFTEGMKRLGRLFRRYEHLPEVPFFAKTGSEAYEIGKSYAVVRDIFRTIYSIPERADQAGLDWISDILSHLETKPERLLFDRFISMRNYTASIARGQLIRFGFEHDENGNQLTERQSIERINEYFEHLKQLVRQNENVQNAIRRRDEMMKGLAEELYKSGIISKASAENYKTYFHQRVFEYLAASQTMKSRTHINQESFQKRRVQRTRPKTIDDLVEGVDEKYDYVTNWAESEYVFVRAANMELLKKVRLQQLSQVEDISHALRDRAKRENYLAVVGGEENDRKIKRIRKFLQAHKDGALRAMTKGDFLGLLSPNEIASLPKNGNARRKYIREILKQLDPLDEFRVRMGRAKALLAKALDDGGINHVDPLGYYFLQIVQQAGKGDFGQQAKIAARSWFKAFADREAKIKQILQDRYQTMTTLLRDPEFADYDIWQPEVGNYFYTILGIPEDVAESMKDIGQDLIEIDALREYTVKGGLKPFYVMRKPIVDQLNQMDKDLEKKRSIAGTLAKRLTAEWKRYTLMNPVTILAYTIRNITGDLEPFFSVFAPSFLSGAGRNDVKRFMGYIKESENELREYFQPFSKSKIHKKPTGDVAEALDHSVIQSSFAAVDMPNKVTTAELMSGDTKTLLEKWGERGKGPLKAYNNYMAFASTFTEYREGVLRLAAYKFAKHAIEADRTITLKHGGGVPLDELKMIAEQRGPQYAAARYSRNILGDYGELSVGGQWMRDNLMWFYSFMEVNGRRWYEIISNHYSNAKNLKGADRFRYVTSAGVGTAAMSLLFSLLNNLLAGDEEEQLSITERQHPHLIIPKWIHRGNETVILRNVGSFGDIASWLNVWSMPIQAAQIVQGQRGLGETAVENFVKAPSNKAMQSLSPWWKLPVELAGGVSFFPDATQPRSIRHKRGEHLANQFRLGDPYREVTGRLWKTGARARPGSWTSSFMQVTGSTRRNKDNTLYMPWKSLIGMSNARRYALDDAYTLRDMFMKEKSYGIPTRGSRLFRNMAEAAEMGDYSAFEESLVSWRRQKNKDAKRELSEKELFSKFRTSAKALDVIGPRMNDEMEKQFYEWLTPPQRRKVDLARRHAADMELQLWLWYQKASERLGKPMMTEAIKQDVTHNLLPLLRNPPMALTRQQRKDGVTIKELRDSYDKDVAAAKKWMEQRGVSAEQVKEVMRKYILESVSDPKARRAKLRRLYTHL